MAVEGKQMPDRSQQETFIESPINLAAFSSGGKEEMMKFKALSVFLHDFHVVDMFQVMFAL